MSKTSFIVLTYSDKKYSKEANKSILNQTFKNFEFIIDNRLINKTSKIIKSYADSRNKFLEKS